MTPEILSDRRIGSPTVFSTALVVGDLSQVTAVRWWIKKVNSASSAAIASSHAVPIGFAGTVRAASAGDPGGFDGALDAVSQIGMVPGLYAVDFEYQLTGSAVWRAGDVPAFVAMTKVANS